MLVLIVFLPKALFCGNNISARTRAPVPNHQFKQATNSGLLDNETHRFKVVRILRTQLTVWASNLVPSSGTTKSLDLT